MRTVLEMHKLTIISLEQPLPGLQETPSKEKSKNRLAAKLQPMLIDLEAQ